MSVVKTVYTNVPVEIPDSFLAPLRDPSIIEVSKIDFENSPLPEYKRLYAVVLDKVLSEEECDQLIFMAEMNYEVLALDYRNSDRIIWDERVIAKRLWDRILQAKGMKEYFSKLEGEAYVPVIGDTLSRGERWVVTRQGLNERLRFLKYGAGQFFREHCDSYYITSDGSQRSFYTYHLYLNDSAQALGIPESSNDGKQTDRKPELLRGGATTFHSVNRKDRLDVDPKIGRVLIFQHRQLFHSGDEVTAGIKYTMRSDVMFEFEGGSDGGDGDIIFAE